MARKKNQLESELLNDFEELFDSENSDDEDSIVVLTANLWRDFLLISDEHGMVGTTSLMVDTFQRNTWAAMTGHLDMSDYRVVWEYDPYYNDVTIYNYLENELDG